ILVDGEDKILSLPPVVNSNDLGRITPGTRNILVEVTGTDSETVHNTLKIMVACLAERGGRVYSCAETYAYGSPRKVVSPNLSPTLTKLSLSRINRLLGTSLVLKDAARFAEKAGYRVQRESFYSPETENDHSHCDEKLGPDKPSGVSVPEHACRLSSEDLRSGSKHQSRRELVATSQGGEEGRSRDYSRSGWFYRDTIIAR